jgi:hypothetical protein
MARLEREARVLATLSDPHTGSLDLIEDIPAPAGGGPGARALVLELVGGETLADHLARAFAAARTGLPVAEVLEIAAQRGRSRGLRTGSSTTLPSRRWAPMS